MPGHRYIGRSRATWTLVALVALVACLGSVAYAATRPVGERSRLAPAGNAERGPGQGPPRPELLEVPPASVISGGYQFRFHISPPPQRAGQAGPGHTGPPAAAKRRRFLCRLDGVGWNACTSPFVLPDLDLGDHAFAVRALSPGGRAGLVAHYSWAQLQPMEFTIGSQASSLEDLMPGAPAQPLPVRVGNPNPVPIEVTYLTVAVAPDRPGCPADPNFEVTPAALTPAAPLGVPAGGSAEVPAVTAPTLALRELPTDQNACQGATIHLVFSAEAHG